MRLLLCMLVTLLAAGAATASAATRDCGTLSLRAGSVYGGAKTGPACLLAAFRSCRAARFTLSSFGVDTVATDVFRVVPGSCRIDVAGSFRVVPQKPRSLSATCRALRRSGGDVLAVGCTGKLGSPISLTGRRV